MACSWTFPTQPGRPGFTIPVAVTGTLWYEYIDLEPDTLPAGQSATGRLWDVLSLAAVAARRGADSDRVTFRVIFEMPDDRRETVKAIMTIGGEGPNGGPAITIMLPEDD